MLIPFVNRFLHWSVVGLVSPVLVLMIMSKGVPLGSAGLVMAAMSAAVVTFELPSGLLSDLAGRRRVYLLSIAIAMAGYAMMLGAEGFLGVTVAATLYGVSRAFSSGSIEALYIDAFIEKRGKERLPALMTAMGVAEALGLALGALAGGYIPMLWTRLYPRSNPYNGNLAAQLAVLATLSCLTLASTRRDAPRSEATRPGSSTVGLRLGSLLRESAATLRGNGKIASLVAGAAFWGFSFSAVETYWQPRLRGILGGAETAWLFGLVGGAYFAAAIAGNVIAAAVLGKTRLRAGLPLVGALRIATAGSILALAAQGSAPGFAALFLTVMCCNGLMSVPESTVFNAELPPSARASFLSLASLAAQLGGIVSSLAFSAALRFVSIEIVWLAAGATLLVSAFLYFRPAGSRRRAPAGSGAPASGS